MIEHAGMHTHTNDIWIVVVKGAYLYKDEAGNKRVGAGSFLRVSGGKKHWSGGDPKRGRFSTKNRLVISIRSPQSRRQFRPPSSVEIGARRGIRFRIRAGIGMDHSHLSCQ